MPHEHSTKTAPAATVWVFTPTDGVTKFPCGVWASRESAVAWIRRVDARGVLSAYILDESAYDSNIRLNLLKLDGKPERTTPEFMRTFTTAVDHEHCDGAVAYAVQLGRDQHSRPSQANPQTGKTLYQCVCCNTFALDSVDQCDICTECGWEDWYECHDFPDQTIRPNYISLNLARSLVKRFGPGAGCEANNAGGGIERAMEIEAMTPEQRALLKTARQRVEGD